jgi:hypothetical protein
LSEEVPALVKGGLEPSQLLGLLRVQFLAGVALFQAVLLGHQLSDLGKNFTVVHRCSLAWDDTLHHRTASPHRHCAEPATSLFVFTASDLAAGDTAAEADVTTARAFEPMTV